MNFDKSQIYCTHKTRSKTEMIEMKDLQTASRLCSGYNYTLQVKL